MGIRNMLLLLMLLSGTIAVPTGEEKTKENIETFGEEDESPFSMESIEELQKEMREIKELSNMMLEILKENNNLLKNLKPQSSAISIENPILRNDPYLMKPITVLGGQTKFPKKIHVHIEGTYLLPENLALRLGWKNGDTDFDNDDLAYALHIRWNGHHFEYAGADFDRKLVPSYRVSGEWGGPGEVDAEWPFKINERFSIDITYEDGCFTTEITNERTRVEFPMCHQPQGKGDLYFSLNADKDNILPVSIQKIYIPFK